MAKYLITSECNKRCSYCISKNVGDQCLQDNNIGRISNLLSYVGQTENRLEITGGEPTLDPKLLLKVLIANDYFSAVSLRSGQAGNVPEEVLHHLKDINVSVHDLDYYLKTPVCSVLQFSIPAYVSIGRHQHEPGMAQTFAELGYNGMTIWEDVWTSKFNVTLELGDYPEWFSVRHLTKDKCLDHEMIILPDLDLISGKEYELRFLGEHNEDTLTHIQLAAATM